MTHLHIPDGLLPAWLIAITWSLAIALLMLAARRTARNMHSGMTALTAVMVTLMLLGNSMPFLYHINLTVLAGILLGPASGFIAVFLTNLILALFGHGGLTAVGLNSLLMGLEPVLGYFLFKGGLHLWGHHALRQTAAAAVMTAMPLVSFLNLGIIAFISSLPGTLLQDADFHGLRFGGTYFAIALPGWMLEAGIIALVLGYIYRLRPGLIIASK